MFLFIELNITMPMSKSLSMVSASYLYQTQNTL